MQKVNYDLLPKRHKRKVSDGFRSVSNSFYEPESHHGPYLTEYHGVYVENPFGLRFSEENQEVDKDRKVQQRPLLD